MPPQRKPRSGAYKVAATASLSSAILLVVLFVFFLVQANSVGGDTGGWIMVEFILIAICLGVISLPIVLVAIVMGHRQLPADKSKPRRLIPLYLWLGLLLIPVGAIVLTLYNQWLFNLFGVQIDHTKYNDYSEIRQDVDNCRIYITGIGIINMTGREQKGNVYVFAVGGREIKEPFSHYTDIKNYNLRANERMRLYNDLKNSSCKYDPEIYDPLIKGPDDRPLDY